MERGAQQQASQKAKRKAITIKFNLYDIIIEYV